MPYFLAVIAVQVLCVVHAVKTGRTQPWIYILVFLPLVGSIAYFVVEMLPELANTRRARKVALDVRTVLDPDRDYRERKDQVELSGTPSAKAAFADECAKRGMFEDAAAMYRSALTGLFADDPHLLLGYAKVLIEKGDFAECQKTLDHLKDKNPDFQSSDGHLIYARSLEGQNKVSEALHEYEALAGYYPGYEAKVRYALYLQKIGEVGKAREMVESLVANYSKLPRHAQDLNRDWMLAAKRNLKG